MDFCDPKLIFNCFFFIWFWVSLLFSLLHFLILENKQWLSIFNSNMILVVHLDSRFPQHFVGSNDESHHLCFAVFPFHRFLQRNQRNQRKSEKKYFSRVFLVARGTSLFPKIFKDQVDWKQSTIDKKSSHNFTVSKQFMLLVLENWLALSSVSFPSSWKIV